MSLFSDITAAASRAVNSALGEQCTYTMKNGSSVVTDVFIYRDREVYDSGGVVVGYRTEAAILKEDIPSPKIGDILIDEYNVEWKVSMIVKETTSKWYLDLVEV